MVEDWSWLDRGVLQTKSLFRVRLVVIQDLQDVVVKVQTDLVAQPAYPNISP